MIRDKRGQQKEQPAFESVEATAASPSAASAFERSGDSEHAHAGPPLSFSTFIISLGTSTLMLMGEQVSAEHPAGPVNLPQAKEIIDILSLLEEKTRGNLTEEEAKLIRDMLYTLQMKYVALASGSSSPA